MVCVNLVLVLQQKNCARKRIVFWKNLHNWHKFYTIAGRDGRDKSHLWLNIVNLMISIEKNCLFLINCNSDSPFFSCCPSLSSPWWKRSRPLEAVTWWECFRNESTLSHCMKFIQFTKHNSNQFKRDEILVMSENKRWQQGWLLGFRLPTQHRSNLFCPFWMKWSEVSMSFYL